MKQARKYQSQERLGLEALKESRNKHQAGLL
jgi:hypothetical protein